MSKSSTGNYFEDFRLGQEIGHATPRTITPGDTALYIALTGSRFPLHCSDEFARNIGFAGTPIDDLLVFNIIFGRTVPDISLNAVANLGYAACRFDVPVHTGDTLSASSRIIGLRQTSNRRAGVVYVHSVGTNQRGETVLEFIRWVMVAKREEDALAPETVVPDLPSAVTAADISVPVNLDPGGYNMAATGCPLRWDDYAAGERIDHVSGVTIEEAEHMMATRLYQNTARAHFDQHAAHGSRFGRRIVYGGHIISLARALTFEGLANGFRIAAINGGSHTAPVFAGDTIYAWSQVREKIALAEQAHVGALRLRTVALKDHPGGDFPDRGEDGRHHPSIVLDIDYTVLIPKVASSPVAVRPWTARGS